MATIKEWGYTTRFSTLMRNREGRLYASFPRRCNDANVLGV